MADPSGQAMPATVQAPRQFAAINLLTAGGLLAALDGRGLLDRGALADADAETLQEVLTFAARVAAVTCTRDGADPPRREELADT